MHRHRLSVESGQKLPTAQFSGVALLVEDDPELHDVMTWHLQAMQFRVLASFNYRTAVRHLDTETPDIVCVDLGLPSESGYELCEHIRRKPSLARVPILITSGRSSPQDMARAEEAGANVFLKKPFSMARLTASIEMLLEDGLPSQRGVQRLACS